MVNLLTNSSSNNTSRPDELRLPCKLMLLDACSTFRGQVRSTGSISSFLEDGKACAGDAYTLIFPRRYHRAYTHRLVLIHHQHCGTSLRPMYSTEKKVRNVYPQNCFPGAPMHASCPVEWNKLTVPRRSYALT
jgi:hypothetical protein